MSLRQILQRRDAIRTELRGLNDAATGGALDEAAQTRWTALEAEVATLAAQESRLATMDALDRRSSGELISGTGDDRLDRMVDSVNLLDVIRAGLGGPLDAAAGRAREVSQELERRSGRKAQGLYWNMNGGAEQRTLTTALPAGGPGSNIIGTDYRPELFIDRLRAATAVRAMGATVLTGLQGNVVIPRRKASVAAGWVAENTALPVSDPQFDGVTLSPKHAGVISEFSRNMILQASPDVEQLARADMAAVLAEVLDTAAISGTGTGAQPRGILNTAGIGSVAMGTNGGALTYDAVADLMGQVADVNGTGTGFLANTKVRRQASKLKDTSGQPLGLDVVFQGNPVTYSNIVPSNGTKGTGAGLSSLIYGNWSDLLIGVWSELDIVTNPYDSAAYSKGNILVRAMLTVDIALRHPESMAAITDLVA